MIPYLLKRRTTSEAFTAGFNCGLHGPNTENCHFSLFSSPEMTAAWERGKRAGQRSLDSTPDRPEESNADR